MLKQRKISILLALACAFTLLNSNAFGSTSLIAFLFYALTISATAVLLFGQILINRRTFTVAIPAYIKVFAILALYVFVHGLIHNNIGIIHYYWGANLLAILTAYYWFATNSSPADSQSTNTSLSVAALSFLRGIAIIVLLESLVVLLQCIYIIPVPNPFFLCTGTWMNPNVTAMFLSMGLFAVIQAHKHTITKFGRFFFFGLLLLTLLAIAVLQCRSAYMATLIIIGAAYGVQIVAFLKSRLKLNLTGVALSLVLAIALLSFVSVFVTKKTSAYNRLQIWRTSGELIAQQPLTGHGFGLFEKEYNLLAASKQYEQNDYINMPYNDFIELGVEGGLVALLFWVAFIVLAWRHLAKGGFANGLLPVLPAFLVIQLTNFGFQAIPAFVLFVLYMGAGNNLLGHTVQATQQQRIRQRYWQIGVAMAGLTVAIGLFYQVAQLTGLFYTKWMIGKAPVAAQSLKDYQRLLPGLNGYASFHEKVGDLLLYQKQPEKAKAAYLKALERTSETNVLAKCGYCYQLQGRYDSSEYYYKLTQYMQPHKFTPHLRLLKLYEQERDSAQVAAQSLYIINKPVKISSKKVLEIKRYAAIKLDSCTGTNTYTKLLQGKTDQLNNEN